MKKAICIGTILLFMMTGCSSKPYHIEEQKVDEIVVSNDAYILANMKLKTITKSEYEKEKTVFYINDEVDLAKAIQYRIAHGKKKVAYQSENEIDLDKTAKLLTYFNPYDISLQLSTTDYKDGSDTLVYRSNVVEIKKMDERYDQAKQMAERIYPTIIKDAMDNNQKIEAIHDFLVKNVIYNVEAQSNPDENLDVFKAAGALVDGDAVCSGYSRAFMMLAKMANIPSMYVGSDTMNHGWNLVYGNDGWRYIDVTWDDPVPDIPGSVEDKFENMSVDEFLRDGSHIFDDDKNSTFYLSLANDFYNKN